MTRPIRIALMTLLGLIALAAIAFWLFVPRHRIAPVTITAVDRPSGQIRVRFAVPEDLEQLRKRLPVGFITAALFACEDREAETREVVTQGSGYFSDRGRVVRHAPSAAQGHQYVATFDPRLARTAEDGRIRFIPAAAAPGGQCFALDGGNMFLGRVWSDPMRLPPLR